MVNLEIKNRVKITVLSVLTFVNTALYSQSTGNTSLDLMLRGLLEYSVPLITVDELELCLDSVLLMDTRTAEEFAISSIQGATYVGYKDFDITPWLQLPRETPIVVYCSVGYRSEKIGEEFQSAGFSDVKNLHGGIFHWANSGKTIVDDCDEPTLKLHAYNELWGVWINGDSIQKVYNH